MKLVLRRWRWPLGLVALLTLGASLAAGWGREPVGRAQSAAVLEIEGPAPATGAGGVVRHTLVVTNTGDVAVRVRLQTSDNAWAMHPGEDIEFEHPAHATLTYTLEAAVPADTVDGDRHEAALRISVDGSLVAERVLAGWVGGRVEAGRWVGCRHDLDADGVVGEADRALVVAGFGRRAADEDFDAVLDLDGDGRVGAGDVQRIVATEGKACAVPVATDSTAAREALDAAKLERHLDGLQEIADAHGGNRAIGTTGYDASADYVAAELEKLGWVVTRQRHNFPRTSISEAVLEIPGETLERGTHFEAFGGSPAGDVRGALHPVDLVVPPGSEAVDSGCQAEDFADFPAGAIALVQRGGCTFRTKIDHAAAAGAMAIVIFNQGNTDNRKGLFGGSVGSGSQIPSMRLSYTAAEPIVERLRGGEAIEAHVAVEITTEDRFGDNILAEWPHGDPGWVVMAGAHLDSVPAGAGLNDNGTGSAGLLALAEVVAAQELRPRHRLRLAWWAAEEIGLLGSARYVAGLSPEERDRLLAYLNFDMIGSPNFIRAIYDGDGSDASRAEPYGSGTIEWAFVDHFDDLGLGHEPIGDVIYRRSDHASFSEAGIPVGGLFSGFNAPKSAEQAAKYGGQEGASADPCYHRACDSIDNVNVEGLEVMADAVAHAVLHFADDPVFPLASGRAYPEQRPGVLALDAAEAAAAEAELRRALSALSAEGGCAAALAEYALQAEGEGGLEVESPPLRFEGGFLPRWARDRVGGGHAHLPTR